MNNLLLEVENGVALLTINRPKSLNALNSETLAELNVCLAELEEKEDVKVVILTGSGEKAFVAGADISEMVNATPAEGRKMGLLAKEAFSRLENMPQVTIAAVKFLWPVTSAWRLTTRNSANPSVDWASCPVLVAHSAWPVWWARAAPRSSSLPVIKSAQRMPTGWGWPIMWCHRPS